jgi:hypothetical protein
MGANFGFGFYDYINKISSFKIVLRNTAVSQSWKFILFLNPLLSYNKMEIGNVTNSNP